MELKKNIAILLTVLSFVLGCSKMNDKHDFYLQDGEIIYLGRVDSARILPGENRFLLRYWITDLRAKELRVYWNQMMDSLIVPIPPHQPSDSIDVIIGDNDNIIPEGNYTFQLISSDGGGLESIIFERLGNVYGQQFSLLLADRFIRNVGFDPDTKEINIEWGEPPSSREIGVEITFFSDESKNVIYLPPEQLLTQTTIENIDVERGLTYRTLFLPEPLAIDTFFTDPVPISILQNVALHKNVTTSSNLNSNFLGTHAVDGVVSSSSRWISTSEAGKEHWIEVDLGKEYNLHSFKLHKHLYNQFLLPNFNFQINKDGEWIDAMIVENFLGDIYEGIFSEEIFTDKIRLFIPVYENNMVRLYELGVYVKF